MQDTTQNAVHGGDSHAYTDPLAIALLSGVGKYDQGSNSLNFQEIRALVDEPQEVPKGEARWCIPSTLQSRDKKRQMDEGQFVALWGDIDAPGIHTIESIAQAVAGIVCGCDFEVYATKSATEETQKCRILVPLASEIAPHQWLTAQAVLNEKIRAVLGIEPDKANGTANQVFFLPNRGDYYASKSQRDGRYLAPLSDWAQDMAEHHERQARDREAVKKAQEAAKKARQELKAEQTRRGKSGLIDAFDAAHYVGDILTQQGYDQNPINPNLYRHPNSESGNYSASVQRDAKGVARVHSLSSADPLYTEGGGKGAHDAFGVFELLVHGGDQKKALTDAGDNWLAIGGESWNAVVRREFRQTTANERANAGFDPLDLVDPDTGEIAPTPEKIEIQAITLEELETAPLAPRTILKNLLYADVRLRVAAGGVGKTTVALFEAITLALGRPLWGRTPERPVKTAFVTREDCRHILVARMREIMIQMALEDDEKREAIGRIQILDMSDRPFRVSCIDRDVVTPHTQNLDLLINALEEWKPDWIILDPLVSFGVGENRVNDAEQGLIEAFRILRNKLDCCIEGIHHSGKANAREAAQDQYAGRGGSALPDGSRMVTVMRPLDPEEWRKATGESCPEGSQGIVMALPKLSYCRPPEPIYILRTGFRFEMVTVQKVTPEMQRTRDAGKVFEFVRCEYEQGRKYSKDDLDKQKDALGMSRDKIRQALAYLAAGGWVEYQHEKGKSGSHYKPSKTLFTDRGDTSSEYLEETIF